MKQQRQNYKEVLLPWGMFHTQLTEADFLLEIIKMKQRKLHSSELPPLYELSLPRSLTPHPSQAQALLSLPPVIPGPIPLPGVTTLPS